MRPLHVLAATIVCAGVAGPLLAQSAGRPDAAVTLRGGVGVSPTYPGSDDYTLAPRGGVSLDYLNLGGREVGSLDRGDRSEGLRLRGAFRIIPERTSDDAPELEGLDDIDTALELGLGLGYETQRFAAFADVRYGVTGHDALTGTLGADARYPATDRLTLSLGPRFELGGGDFANTYFGIDEDAASSSQFDAYDPDGGLLSAGLELGARYDLSGPWGVEGAVTWDRYVGDVADSPIVEDGSRDQFGARVTLTRQITFGF